MNIQTNSLVHKGPDTDKLCTMETNQITVNITLIYFLFYLPQSNTGWLNNHSPDS